MRAALLLLLPLAGCGDDFDSRYEDAGAEIEARASSMDADLARHGATGAPRSPSR